ncbi:RpiR family transcriptional regulator [Salsuginibacillus halophilus]|uniref:RpiR family transcriptional regulator n=1 Tax=Salsuginibacillus halophilus TaxID=517424 RepID=A0A2P8HQK0_9BACI|nr:MurR/RpiR family transcriptional regulator [Salsuginibacillus halophilus]PSL48496.1 RpiR family transcriptional regulator [Salsuginibacillus halophilus]
MVDTVIVAKIRNSWDEFTQAERKVADYILNNGEFVPTMTTKQLAAEANASESSIIRFCKRIGMESFRMLKVALAQEFSHGEPAINSTSLLESNDSSYTLLQKVSTLNRMGLDMTPKTVGYVEFEQVVEALKNTRSVAFFGVGGAYSPAVDGEYKFMRLGYHATASADYHYMLPLLRLMETPSVVFCLSTSGRTHEVVKVAEYAKERGITVVAITRLETTPLYRAADYVLPMPDVEFENRIGSIASRTIQLNLIDALYVSIFRAFGSDLLDAFGDAKEKADERRK